MIRQNPLLLLVSLQYPVPSTARTNYRCRIINHVAVNGDAKRVFPHIFNLPLLVGDAAVRIKPGASLHKLYFHPSPASNKGPALSQESVPLESFTSVALVVHSLHSSKL